MHSTFARAVAIVTLALATPGYAEDDDAANREALAAAVANEARGANAARDEFRHPFETLEFFQVEPGMTVVDYFPGNVGWYTDILVPYLGSTGSYIGANSTVPGASEQGQASQRAFPEKFPQDVNAHLAEVGITGAPVSAVNLESLPEGMDGTVDRFLIFRFVHNLHRWDMLHDTLTKARALLTDDGMLGITEHRAKPDAPYSYADGNNGYMREVDVIKLVEAQGFELVGKSEINANPRDPANHVGGVWQLPPASRSDDPALKAIGESDRMTLLFRKRP